MSFYVWCEVVCAECSDTSQGQFVTGDIPRRELKQQALREGFIFPKGMSEAFCSKKCHLQYMEKNK